MAGLRGKSGETCRVEQRSAVPGDPQHRRKARREIGISRSRRDLLLPQINITRRERG
jgi:hypothetical protein